MNAVADQPSLTVPSTITVSEDTASTSFSIAAAATDMDGSETITLVISDVPLGATISDGAFTFVASLGNTAVDVTNWNWSSLTVTPPANSDTNFTLAVTATATEAANSDQNSKSDTIAVEVTAVADQPNLTVPATVAVNEDTQSAAVFHDQVRR